MSKSRAIAIFVALMLVTTAGTVSAQTQPPVAATPPARGEAEILKTIIFIDVEVTIPAQYGHAAKPGSLHGTGVFVAIPDNHLGANRSFAYIVTNRRVAEAMLAEFMDLADCVSRR
jgi:hypothetical protein